jgi:hypothetical protein
VNASPTAVYHKTDVTVTEAFSASSSASGDGRRVPTVVPPVDSVELQKEQVGTVEMQSKVYLREKLVYDLTLSTTDESL